MRKIFLYSLVLILSFSAEAQIQNLKLSTAPDPVFFKEMVYDFGKISQGRPVTHNFEIVNSGVAPLTVENVITSCGCTTPIWDKEPVAPGKTTKINVGYNSVAEGDFEKTITVVYNGGQTKVLSIKGHVWKTPDGPAPVNSSVKLLNQINKN